MLESGTDLSIIIGGFNSSNTMSLTNIAASYAPAFHIEDAAHLLASDKIHHKPVGRDPITEEKKWLPEGKITISLTAGASTPNAKIGEVIERILQLRGEHIHFDESMTVAH